MTRQPSTVASPHLLRSGERVGRYQVGRLLHEGGMAWLYEARVGARLAGVFKVPKLGPTAPLSSFVSFENEWRILERAHGPQVPRLLATGDLERAPWLLLEYLPGAAFADAARRAPLPLDELCGLGVQLCRALHELHRQNIVHLDLNPSNLRERADGTLVLIDYGLAHHAGLPDLHDTAFGEEEGTTPYIAPEQLHHVRTDSRSDIYALGAILYQFATGEYPFGRPNLLSLKKRLVQPPPPPRHHRPELPAWLQEVILRCLEIDPAARYVSAKQVAHLLVHPEAVAVTARGRRTELPDWPTRARQWWRSIFQKFDEGAALRPYERMTTSPHVLVAIDPAHAAPALQEALRRAVRRLAAAEPDSYFTCLTLVPAKSETGTASVPALAAAQVQLRHWAQPLRLASGRVVFQVLPGAAAAGIVRYADAHLVDHIVLAARGHSRLRRYLGSVSAQVAAQAACTVTVVRSRRERSAASDASSARASARARSAPPRPRAARPRDR